MASVTLGRYEEYGRLELDSSFSGPRTEVDSFGRGLGLARTVMPAE